MARVIVTSALPYAYSMPHLGNFVGSVLPADVYYKYLRMKGDDAIFICGSDQHGTPIELAALQKGAAPEQLADEMHAAIKSLYDKYECGFTHYGKTHTPENKEVVYSVFNELYRNGYILETEDMQAYCNVDKRFLPDRFIQGTCPYCHTKNARGDQCDNCGRLLEPGQIIDPFCVVCGKSDISFVKSKNLALDLTKLQDKIKAFIKENSKNNWSKDAVNKSLSMIKQGLKPRDITRNMKWGFPVPLAGYENATLYVWFDAVLGYIGITKEWDPKRWRDYWQNEHTQLVQFMGKDNTIFHSIMWPAMLIGSNLGFVLPYTLKISQHPTSKEVKFSKSKGVGLNMRNALEIMPADCWRFALMHSAPENADSEFTKEVLEETVNTILNDKIGNFVQRTLKLALANKALVEGGVVPSSEKKVAVELERYADAFDSLQFKKAVAALVGLAEQGNRIMSDREPWLLAKAAKNDAKAAKEAKDVLSSLIAITYALGVMLHPFTPEASKKLLAHFKVGGEPTLALLGKTIELDIEKEPHPLFAKLTQKELEKLQKYA